MPQVGTTQEGPPVGDPSKPGLVPRGAAELLFLLGACAPLLMSLPAMFAPLVTSLPAMFASLVTSLRAGLLIGRRGSRLGLSI